MQATVQVNLRLPPALAARIEEIAAREGWSQRTTYIHLLGEALDLTPNELIDLLQPPRRRGRTLRASTG